jgi:hypothetical protein
MGGAGLQFAFRVLQLLRVELAAMSLSWTKCVHLRQTCTHDEAKAQQSKQR